MDGSDWITPLLALAAVLLACLALLFYWLAGVRRPLRLQRLDHNPVLRPRPEVWWESEAAFNPAALVHDGRVHLFYRALGRDGITRTGHASSGDGIHFDERSPTPIFQAESAVEAACHYPFTSPARLTYDTI